MTKCRGFGKILKKINSYKMGKKSVEPPILAGLLSNVLRHFQAKIEFYRRKRLGGWTKMSSVLEKF